ncbi:MAG: hypothetical protein AAF203_00025 [Pseudomonadota bacterium]
MHRGYFSLRIHCLFLSFLLYGFPTHAKNQCPPLGSPGYVALKYQMYTAYTIGFDGYEAPCEIRCMGKASCQKKCQKKEGLRTLASKYQEFQGKMEQTQCPSLVSACLEQCETDGGASCAQACSSPSVAKTQN